MDISIVVPVYRSSSTINELCERIVSTVSSMQLSYEVILVEDGCPECSLDSLNMSSLAGASIKKVRLYRNYGQQRAILCGFELAKGNFVVTMDADLQQPPEEIQRLYNEICSKKLDLVIARFPNRKHGLLRKLGTKLVKLTAQRSLRIPSEIDFTSFRIMRQPVAKNALKLKNINPVIGYLVAQVTNKIGNVDVAHNTRASGKSTYSLAGLINYFSVMILDYSDLPIRWVRNTGVVVALTSFLLGTYYLFAYLSGRTTISGFTTLVILVCFFSGLILLTLSTIGNYLGRIYMTVSANPRYLIREISE